MNKRNFQRTAFVFLMLICFSIETNIAQVISIAEARTKSLGTVVKVAGRITVANQFGGPSYFQDETAGLAFFASNFSSQVTIGDSVVVTGPLAIFPTNGTALTQLVQITGTGTTVEIIQAERKVPDTLSIPVSVLNADGEKYEGMLVKIVGVKFIEKTAFQPNTNYRALQGKDTMQIRIDNNTDLVQLPITTGTIDIIGVLGQFSGRYQLSPRFVQDLGATKFVNPGDSIPRNKTFDITTWNLNWFGDPRAGYGPANDSLQFANIARVLSTINSEIYALQEVTSVSLFNRMLDTLRAKNYNANGFYPGEDIITQTQRPCFIWRGKQAVATTFLFEGTQAFTGRFPVVLEVTLQDNLLNPVKLYLINIHAKASQTAADYTERQNDALRLYNYLISTDAPTNFMVVGDFNDGMTKTYSSTTKPSPYAMFTSDTAKFTILTKALELRGEVSYPSTVNGSMLDHGIISKSLEKFVFADATVIENLFYISNQRTTTSDHIPVTFRFPGLSSPEITTNIEENSQSFEQNFVSIVPQPSSDWTEIVTEQPVGTTVEIKIISILGNNLFSSTNMSHSQVTKWIVDTKGFADGVYIVQIRSGNSIHSGKMVVRH